MFINSNRKIDIFRINLRVPGKVAMQRLLLLPYFCELYAGQMFLDEKQERIMSVKIRKGAI
jgi:hypothetical protein